MQQWLNYFTRIGFVLHHKEQIDTIEIIQRDNLRQLFIEIEKKRQRDEDKILKLKHDIRENAKMISEFGLGTPIISHIKANADRARRKYDELVNKIRMKNPQLLNEL